MLDSLLLLWAFVRATVRSRSELAVENLLLRQQLAVLTRPTRKRPRLRPLDRLFWALARHLRRDWRQQLFVVRPETVSRWHRLGWRLFWRWKSTGHLGRLARPGGLQRPVLRLGTDRQRPPGVVGVQKAVGHLEYLRGIMPG